MEVRSGSVCHSCCGLMPVLLKRCSIAEIVIVIGTDVETDMEADLEEVEGSPLKVLGGTKYR